MKKISHRTLLIIHTIALMLSLGLTIFHATQGNTLMATAWGIIATINTVSAVLAFKMFKNNG